MDFEDTPEEAAFRAEVREWLHKNAVARKDQSIEDLPDKEGEGLEEVSKAKRWQALKADAGYAFIEWPEEYGGQASMMNSIIFAQEEAEFVQPRNYFANASVVGPTIMKFCDDETKKRFLEKMLRGEEIWSLLFSEPVGGSDLGGLRTRASRDGDDWVINGQKVWTSFAQYADWGVLVARTDPSVAKHKGLTYFIVDLKDPGFNIKPIKQMDGGAGFNEVFIDNVRVPDSRRVGNVGGGWGVVMSTLANERFSVGRDLRPDVDELLALVNEIQIDGKPAIKDDGIRQQVADLYAQFRGIRNTQLRTLTAMSKGKMAGPEASILKLVNANKWQQISSLGMDLQELGGIITDPEVVGTNQMFVEGFLASPGLRLAGGTDEIMMNIVAERVLGLPPEIRVDKEKPFTEIPTGRA